MRNTNKKGFTIVELVIVVAVIAILAAVLIPTFSGIIAKANESADIQLARNIDTKLAYSTATNLPTTFQDVVNIMKNEGYDLSRVVTRSGATIAWDKTSNSMVLISANGEILYNEANQPYAELKVPVYDDEKIPTVVSGACSSLEYVAMCNIDNASASFGGHNLDLNNNYLSVTPTSVGTVSNGFVKTGVTATTANVTTVSSEVLVSSNITSAGYEDSATKTITIKGVVFTAAAVKDLEIKDLSEKHNIVIEDCIFDNVRLAFSNLSGSDVTINNCVIKNATSYCVNFGNDTAGKVVIKDTVVENCARGFLLRTPTTGADVTVDNCTFSLSDVNYGENGKARAIQIATSAYYYNKNADASEYYGKINGAFNSNTESKKYYSILNGKINITNNDFVKASYGVYIYEAEGGGGFTYGGSSQTTLFGDISGNTFGSDCIFKYGCGNIGDGRSYTDKGYNTGFNEPASAATEAARNAINGFKAEDYWDQMIAIKELEAVLK